MKYKFNPAEKSTVKITIEFDQKEWNDATVAAYNKTKSRFAVNGFRKGKAPKNVIENFYGKGVFFDEALNILFSNNYPTVLDSLKSEFTAVGDPALSVEKLDDTGCTIVAMTPVKPDVTIETYKGIKIREFVYTVSDADVDKEVENLRVTRARDVEVTDRAAKAGDTANINFVGTIDGVEFDGGSADNYDLVLGSGTFIPGFEDQVVGMTVGEKKDVNVTFPENYQATTLKGKAAVFAVTLNSIKEKELPELTDEFVKEATGMESIEAYKAKAKERLTVQAEKRGRDETENSIIAAICDKASAVIPDAMVEDQIDSIMQNVNYQLMYQGLDLDTYLDYIKQSKAEFRGQYKEQATKNVLSQLVMEKIIKTEGIGATEAEVDEKIAQQAKDVEKSFEEYKANMDPRQKAYIEQDIVVTKLFNFLKENNEMYVEA